MTGVLDRLLTYASGNQLNEKQLEYLSLEGKQNASIKTSDLVKAFNQQVDKALEQLRSTSENTLTEQREVGRGKLPSTLIGLLIHAAEHTTRHTGQLFVIMKVVKNSKADSDSIQRT